MIVPSSKKLRNGLGVDRNVQAIVDLERKALDERAHINRFTDIASKMITRSTIVDSPLPT